MPIDTSTTPQSGGEKKGGVFVPHFFFDDLMPALKDTEFKVLLLVYRKTLGFQSADGKGRKTRAWLTHSYLKKGTGRSTQAVVSAIDQLVRQNLLFVHLEDGTLVLTPQERRRARAKLWYALSPYLLNRVYEADPRLKKKVEAQFLEIRIKKLERSKQERIINYKNKEADFSVSKPQTLRVSTGWSKVGDISRAGKEAA